MSIVDPTDLRDLQRLVARTFRPPVKDVRFWVVEMLVAVIAITDWWLLLHPHPLLPAFVPVALYSVPVVYAALNFGLAGALATAGLVVALTLPSLALNQNVDVVWAELIELFTIVLIATVVGDRVEREVSSRTAAERSEEAMSRSEAQFRTLFEVCPAPILLLDPNGSVYAANPAAALLFARSRASLMDSTLADLVGSDNAAQRIVDGEGDFEIPGPDGQSRYLQAFAAAWPAEGQAHLQLAFFDVSEERRRLGRVDAYAANILNAHEEERRRIAQEVHDEPVQALIHLCRRLDIVAGDESLPAVTKASLAELRQLAESINDELRRLARGLRPPSLDDLGLLAAVRRLLTDLEGRSRVRFELEVHGANRRLGPQVELGLFRIAQEAIRNVERHAHAHVVTVRLAFQEQVVEVEVRDDGIGFRPGIAGEERGRLGLIGMQERATLLGGSLTLESRPGRGTVVRAVVPPGALPAAASSS